MRFFIMLFLIGLAVVFGIQAISLLKQRDGVATRLDALNGQAQALRIEERSLQQDLDYIDRPSAQKKELQSKFNYRKPDEDLFILIPGQ